jgi:hypothetical protein
MALANIAVLAARDIKDQCIQFYIKFDALHRKPNFPPLTNNPFTHVSKLVPMRPIKSLQIFSIFTMALLLFTTTASAAGVGANTN